MKLGRQWTFCFALGCMGAFAQASDEHEWEFSARTRAAHLRVDDQSGKAASVLLRGQITSEWTRALSTVLELDHVETFWQNHHSDGVNQNGEPLIPDVPGTELNQLFVNYEFERVQVRVGRQRIELDDQRFVGSNGYWQNDQTFDALSTEWQLFSASRLNYTYIANANRIFGDDAGAHLAHEDVGYYSSDGERPAALQGDHEQHTHLLHLQANEWDNSRLIGYAYFIDNEDFPAVSNRTFGGKYKFMVTAGAFKYHGEIAAATQERTELSGSPRPPYGLLDLSMIHGPWRLVARHEILGADQGAGFVTPLASAHNFQGSADVFAATPEGGLEDTSLHINWRSSPWELDLRYHLFREYSGSEPYGHEFDLDIEFKPASQHSILLRFADFHASTAYSSTLPDRQKVYLDYSYNF